MFDDSFSDQIYHVYNRGVDKRKTFLDDTDYFRFLESLIRFNTNEPEPLVSILGYCLMPNHFHLLLEVITEDGMTKFMHKLGTGYTKYFNIKRKRTGALFETSYKKKRIKNDAYLQQISKYIHLNPLSLTDIKKNSQKKLPEKYQKFLIEYPWSSLKQYLQPNDNSASHLNLKLLNMFENVDDYKNFVVTNWEPHSDVER